MTIRSRGAPVKELLRREFDHYQDAHTGAWYLTITASNAFGFVLDLISCVFIAGVCFSIILMDNGRYFSVHVRNVQYFMMLDRNKYNNAEIL